jgi:hypothetical protein
MKGKTGQNPSSTGAKKVDSEQANTQLEIYFGPFCKCLQSKGLQSVFSLLGG